LKFVCSATDISEACQNVQRAASQKATMPAIEGILIRAEEGTVHLTGYDLEVGIKTSVAAKVEEPGAVVINAKYLCEILRKLPSSQVRIEADERMMSSITSGEANFGIKGISPEDYPELPSVTGGYPIEIKQGLLRDMVRQTIFAVSTNETKLVHKGIKVEVADNNIKLIAVDGYRMAIRSEDIDYKGEELSFVVPSKTFSEVVKLINDPEKIINLGIGKRHIVFDVADYQIVSRLLDGEFLNYRTIIEQNNLESSQTTVRFKTREFIDSIERTALVISDRIKTPLKVAFSPGSVRVSTQTDIGSASDRFDAEVGGAALEIGFNNRLLLEAMRACETDEAYMKLNGPVAPAFILPLQGDSFLYLVLPVKMNAAS